ncbi:MAG: glycosyltransferase [Planctomycetes bacterium]|nr:glycosyltransferase [Planctomycetota bacterium]
MKVERIEAENGQDPLVEAFVQLHGDACAQKGLSVLWCFLGCVMSIVGVYVLSDSPGSSSAAEAIAHSNHLAGSGFHIALSNILIDVPGVLLGLVLGCMSACALSYIITFKKSPVIQECIYGGIAALALYGILYGLYVHFAKAAGIATAIICFIYLAVILFRLLALCVGWRGGSKSLEIQEPDQWPMYTILAPLYKEKNVANNIVAALKNLDYPSESLDVKLLLEADDQETFDALKAANVPDWMEIIVVPDAQPRTKPRACNHGLKSAKGDFLVIFDAEDRPEPDQLKKAVMRFNELDDNVVCIQASLIYHNWRQNLLTRLFALEYNLWFLRYQPGLVRLGGPLPLGGTSNHFKIDALKKVGGWDPYNVTEDCDLGVRLDVNKYKCDLLDSITWEEANSQIGNWLRQRSRWLKGYMIPTSGGFVIPCVCYGL